MICQSYRKSSSVIWIILAKMLGPDSILRCPLTGIANPIVEIRRSYDCLISTMGFPILVRWHLYIESVPWSLWYTKMTNKRSNSDIAIMQFFLCLPRAKVSHEYVNSVVYVLLSFIQYSPVTMGTRIPPAVINHNNDNLHIEGLVQDGSICSALAVEILQSCTKPSICVWLYLEYFEEQ